MQRSRRVTARDVARSGSLVDFIRKLVTDVRNGNMDLKEHAARSLDSLTEQSSSLDGRQRDEQNTVLIARAGAIPPLIELVSSGSTVAQAHACGALARIAHKQAKYQQQILEAGGCGALVYALRFGDSSVQQRAVAALASVSEQRASQEVILSAPGAVPALVLMLKGSVSDETAARACLTLANIADQNLDGQDVIASCKAIPLLIALLEGGKATEAAATLLARLTHGHYANRMELVKLGGIPHLIALLSVINVETTAQAAAALAAICSSAMQTVSRPKVTREERQARQMRHAISKAGGLPPLLALVESRQLSAQRSSVHALAMLSLNCRFNQDAIASMGGITPLVLLCEPSVPPEVQAQAVLALAELSRHNRENQTTIAEAFAIQLLVSLMRTTTAPDVEREVAGALWALSEDHAENKVLIAQVGAIPLLVELLGSTSTELAPVLATNALCSLALGNQANQSEITGLLVDKLLTAQQAETQEHASKTAWRIVHENPGDELSIAQAGGAGPLVKLLRDAKEPSVKAYALLGLSLAIDEKNQAIVANEGGVEPLVKLLSLEDAATREQAACAVQRLALHNTETQLQITKQGAVEPLIALLGRSNSERTQEYAAAALSQLGLCRAGKHAICRNGGVDPLVNLLCDDSKHAKAKQHAASALSRLAQETPRHNLAGAPAPAPAPAPATELSTSEPGTSQAEIIADAGAIEPLIGLVSGEKGQEAQEEAAGALEALARYARNRIAISDMGGIGPLVALLGSHNAKARDHAGLALVRLSIEHSTRVLIIEQLVGMLSHDRGVDAQEQAAAALANLARESVENRTSILKANGIPWLLELLKSESRRTKENSASAISQLAYKNRDNQNAMCDALSNSTLVLRIALPHGQCLSRCSEPKLAAYLSSFRHLLLPPPMSRSPPVSGCVFSLPKASGTWPTVTRRIRPHSEGTVDPMVSIQDAYRCSWAS